MVDIDDDDAVVAVVVEFMDFADEEEEGSLTRERKLRNVDNGEGELFVERDEEDDVGEYKD